MYPSEGSGHHHEILIPDAPPARESVVSAPAGTGTGSCDVVDGLAARASGMSVSKPAVTAEE